MAQGKDNQIWQFYSMDSLPVLWRIDPNLDADMVHINEHFAGKMASPLGGLDGVKKLELVEEEDCDSYGE